MFPDEKPTEQMKADFNSFIDTIQKGSGIPPEYFKVGQKRRKGGPNDFPIKPMLVSEITGYRERIMSQPYVFVQPKLDGHCCMANTRTRRIYSRAGHEITTLPHIRAALPVDGPEWLHGELWKHGATSDSVERMIRLGDGSLELHVFDCVSDEAWGQRDFIVDAFCGGKRMAGIYTIETFKITPSDIKRFYRMFINDGYEGIIIRLDGHGYYHGRSQNVFKMKPGSNLYTQKRRQCR